MSDVKTIKAAIGSFRRHQMTYHAASLTYFGLLSLFPFLLLLVAGLGLLSETSTVDDIISYMRDHNTDPGITALTQEALDIAVNQKSKAGGAFGLGLLISLYSASSGFSAIGTALGVVYETDRRRSFFRNKGVGLLLTLVIGLLVILTLILFFVGGSAAHTVADWLNLNAPVLTAWNILRLPIAAGCITAVCIIIYRSVPLVIKPSFKQLLPGALTAVGLWFVISFGFYLYVNNFDNYNVTYGAFAGTVIVLIWMWLTNISILFGAEINAVLEKRRSASTQ